MISFFKGLFIFYAVTIVLASPVANTTEKGAPISHLPPPTPPVANATEKGTPSPPIPPVADTTKKSTPISPPSPPTPPAADATKKGPSISSNDLPLVSLNNWGGIPSLANFDNFNGPGNFKGQRNQDQVVIVERQVCHSQSIETVQQHLVIIQEVAKQIILQQVCEVEAQVIILHQHKGSFDLFQSDLLRQNQNQLGLNNNINPGFDSAIASRVHQLMNPNGSLNSTNPGFLGKDVGKNNVAVSSNWNNETSPASVDLALKAAKSAAESSHNSD